MTVKRTVYNLEGLVLGILILVLSILFVGTPDLMDAILYRLTDGAIPLPGHEQTNFDK